MIDFPPGATIASLLVATWRTGGAASFYSASMKAFGVHQLPEDRFGHSVGRLSRNLFKGLVSPQQLLQQHTITPFLSRLLDPARAEEWQSKILLEVRHRHTTFLRCYRPGEAFADEWRSCPECQDRDRSRYGVAHWHVAHQLKFLKSCIEHGTPLHFRCQGCHEPIGKCSMRRLPGEACSRCSSLKTDAYITSPSPGYAGTVELCRKLFLGPCEQVTPKVRYRLFAALQSRIGKRGGEEFTRQLLAHWGCSELSELAEILGCPVTHARIKGTLCGAEYSAATPLLLAMCEFASTLTTGAELQDTTPDMFVAPAASLLSQSDWDLFQAHALGMGFPIEAAKRLAEGAIYNRLQCERLASVRFCQKFMNSAPQSIRDQLPQASAGFRKKFTWPKHLAKPDPRLPPADAARTLSRQRLTHLAETGLRTRVELNAVSITTMSWARRHDKDWLDSFCPRQSTGGGKRRAPPAVGSQAKTSAARVDSVAVAAGHSSPREI